MLSPIARKAIYLTDIKKIAFPGRISPSTFHMYDDGTHGDVTASDGTYTAWIKDTLKEGTFSFYFRASGIIGKGAFERDEVIQKYVTLNTASLNILVDVNEIPSVPKVNRYEVVLTPKDDFENFLGPGYARSIKARATQGTIIEGIKDNIDGTYSLFLDLQEKADIRDVYINGSAKDTKFSFNLFDELLRN